MKHVGEEELLLYPEERGREIQRHLAACTDCRRRFDDLHALIAAVERAPVPDRDASYGATVWNRIAPRLPERPRPAWRRFFEVKTLALASAVASLVAVGFIAGRLFPRGRTEALSPEVRERILLVDLGEHLDRSQAVLIELVHAPEDAEGADISREQARAVDLLNANRLYRQSARRAGESNVAGVLDDLERVLLEIAHGPARVSSMDLARLRDRIQAQGVLFRVRVIGTSIREREESRRLPRIMERKTT